MFWTIFLAVIAAMFAPALVIWTVAAIIWLVNAFKGSK